jgi:hypothetical protein
VFDAAADEVVGLAVRGAFEGELLRPAFEGGGFGAAAAEVVGDGVAEDGVEPGDGGLLLAERVGALERADVGGLEDVFGECAVVDAARDEGQEAGALCEEVVESAGGLIGHGGIAVRPVAGADRRLIQQHGSAGTGPMGQLQPGQGQAGSQQRVLVFWIVIGMNLLSHNGVIAVCCE